MLRVRALDKKAKKRIVSAMDPNPKFKSNRHYDYFFKVILLGGSGVGKTTFVNRVFDDVFVASYISTIGIDYKNVMMTLTNGKIVKLQIWDTSGQEVYDAITRNYYRTADGVIYMCDVAEPETIDRITKYYKDMRQVIDTNMPAVLLCNKIDSDHKKSTLKKAASVAKELDMDCFFVSVKENTNIAPSLHKICAVLLKNLQDTLVKQPYKESPKSVDIEEKPKGMCPSWCVIL